MQFSVALVKVLSVGNILRIHMQLMSFMAMVLCCLEILYVNPSQNLKRK